MYFPPYSSELNPIEQFWFILKSKIKRERLLKEENLSSIITGACNNASLEDLKGFCSYLNSKLQVCLNKELL